MNEQAARQVLDTIVGKVFGYQNPLSLSQARDKFAFDVRLPQQVYDTATGQPTWAASFGDSRYLQPESVKKKAELDGNLQPSRTLANLQDIMEAWDEVNYAMSERQIGSTNVAESDGVYHSTNVYRSVDIRKSNNILFSDGVDASEFILAGQTSKSSKYAIRIEDSKNIESSFNVIWSNKISNSFFIRDCYDLVDCMFCTHLAGRRFCIANIQVTEQEYERLKLEVIRWILTS